MNCRQFEEQIYIYDELDDSERRIMDDHQKQCVACDQLADQFFGARDLFVKSQSIKPELQHPFQLTDRIMEQIEVNKGNSFMDVLAYYLDRLFVRYALSALAMFLIIFFVYEQKDTVSTTSVDVTKTEINKGTVLDFSKFQTSYLKRREIKQGNHLSLYTYYKSGKTQ